MATFIKVNDFVRAVAHKQHDLSSGGDALAVFLTDSAFDSNAAVITDLSAAPIDNIGDKSLAVTSSNQSGGQWDLVLVNKTMTSSGGQTVFRSVYIVNTTNDRLVGGYDFLSSQTVEDGQNFIVEFTDASNRFISLVSP